MTAKDYLKRAYLLDKQINVEIHELEVLKAMRGQAQGCCYGEHIGSNPNRNTGFSMQRIKVRQMPKKPKHPCAYPGYNQLVDGRYCEEHTKVRNSQYEKYG